jgi:hypothetical protein
MTFVVFATLSGLICLLLAEMGATRFNGFPSFPKPLQLLLFVSGFTPLVLTVNTLSKGSGSATIFEWNIVIVSGVFALVVMMGTGLKMMLDSFD